MRKLIILLSLIILSCEKISSSTMEQNTEPPYPRLGIWWPDLNNQPIQNLTRYNFIVLGNWQSEFLEPLINTDPKLIVLASTNASEVDFNPNDLSVNAYIQKIPSEWFLTQVGTSLRENIDATQTTIPVSATEKEGIKLFIPGETALIEGESIFIEDVDYNLLTLRVRRGYIRPASEHSAGTRIAAHISFWPNSWVMNVSTLSPDGIIDTMIGPEKWVDFNARLGTHLFISQRWSGIFVDRAGQNQSWLIGNSNARSIDPDQSNTLLLDYSAFDKAWNNGLLSYLKSLRKTTGPKNIILINGNTLQNISLNGSDFEGFPDDQGIRNWHTTMFGDNPINGSYFDWMSVLESPNLTTIETYEEDGNPNVQNADKYFSNCNDPTFTPNYRKMRFGLTSALLNNGYFSYEINTQNTGSTCLMWFDEYDNAGSERGYLGFPIGDAYRLIESLNSSNQIGSGEFEKDDDLAVWETLSKKDNNISATLDSNSPASGIYSVRLSISQNFDAEWKTTFSYAPISVIDKKEYTLSFYARSATPQTIRVWVEQDNEPWDTRLNFGEFLLTEKWQKFELPTTSEASDSQVRVVFGLGKAIGLIWLDNISLQEGNPDLWRRDYNNGIVLVNGTLSPAKVDLERYYLKINGTQDRSINDGSKVNKVMINPHDGIILLSPK